MLSNLFRRLRRGATVVVLDSDDEGGQGSPPASPPVGRPASPPVARPASPPRADNVDPPAKRARGGGAPPPDDDPEYDAGAEEESRSDADTSDESEPEDEPDDEGEPDDDPDDEPDDEDEPGDEDPVAGEELRDLNSGQYVVLLRLAPSDIYRVGHTQTRPRAMPGETLISFWAVTNSQTSHTRIIRAFKNRFDPAGDNRFHIDNSHDAIEALEAELPEP